MKEIIATADAPAAIGPYAQAVKVNEMIFVSGQIPVDPKLNALVLGGIEEQTEQCLLNMRAILEEAGAHLDDVVKVTVYMTNLEHFAQMNKIYTEFFPNSENTHNLLPARSTVEVSKLPKDAEIEIDCIAVISPNTYDPQEIY